MIKENNYEWDMMTMYNPSNPIGIMIRRLQNDKIFGIYGYPLKPNGDSLGVVQYHLMYIVSERNMKIEFNFITKLIEIYYNYDKKYKDCDVNFTHQFFEFFDMMNKGKVVDRRIYFNYKEYADCFINKTKPYSYDGIRNYIPLESEMSPFYIEFSELIRDVDVFIDNNIHEGLMTIDNGQKIKHNELYFIRIPFAEYIDDKVLLKSLKEDFNGITLKLAEGGDDLEHTCCSCANAYQKRYDCLYFFKYKAIMYQEWFPRALIEKKVIDDTTTIILSDDKHEASHSVYNISTHVPIITMEDFLEKINENKQENENRVHTDIIILAKLPEFYITDIEVEFVRAVCRYCGNEIPMEVLD